MSQNSKTAKMVWGDIIVCWIPDVCCLFRDSNWCLMGRLRACSWSSL